MYNCDSIYVIIIIYVNMECHQTRSRNSLWVDIVLHALSGRRALAAVSHATDGGRWPVGGATGLEWIIKSD